MRKALPQRRPSETFNVRFWNQNFAVTVGCYPDGTFGEIFINGGKSGKHVEGTARDAAVVMSLALQHGVSLQTIRHAVTRSSNGEATSILGVIVDQLQAAS